MPRCVSAAVLELWVVCANCRLFPTRFLQKRERRKWSKKVKYDVRKSFADSRLRVRGRFLKKEEEDLLKDLLQMV